MAEEIDLSQFGLGTEDETNLAQTRALFSQFGLGSPEQRASELEEQKKMTRANILFDLAQAGLIIASTPPVRGESPAATLARAAAASQFFPKVGARSAELQKTKTAMDAQQRQVDMAAVNRMLTKRDTREAFQREKELYEVKNPDMRTLYYMTPEGTLAIQGEFDYRNPTQKKDYDAKVKTGNFYTEATVKPIIEDIGKAPTTYFVGNNKILEGTTYNKGELKSLTPFAANRLIKKGVDLTQTDLQPTDILTFYRVSRVPNPLLPKEERDKKENYILKPEIRQIQASDTTTANKLKRDNWLEGISTEYDTAVASIREIENDLRQRNFDTSQVPMYKTEVAEDGTESVTEITVGTPGDFIATINAINEKINLGFNTNLSEKQKQLIKLDTFRKERVIEEEFKIDESAVYTLNADGKLQMVERFKSKNDDYFDLLNSNTSYMSSEEIGPYMEAKARSLIRADEGDSTKLVYATSPITLPNGDKIAKGEGFYATNKEIAAFKGSLGPAPEPTNLITLYSSDGSTVKTFDNSVANKAEIMRLIMEEGYTDNGDLYKQAIQSIPELPNSERGVFLSLISTPQLVEDYGNGTLDQTRPDQVELINNLVSILSQTTTTMDPTLGYEISKPKMALPKGILEAINNREKLNKEGNELSIPAYPIQPDEIKQDLIPIERDETGAVDYDKFAARPTFVVSGKVDLSVAQDIGKILPDLGNFLTGVIFAPLGLSEKYAGKRGQINAKAKQVLKNLARKITYVTREEISGKAFASDIKNIEDLVTAIKPGALKSDLDALETLRALRDGFTQAYAFELSKLNQTELYGFKDLVDARISAQQLQGMISELTVAVGIYEANIFGEGVNKAMSASGDTSSGILNTSSSASEVTQ
jgi:hypothetical protein